MVMDKLCAIIHQHLVNCRFLVVPILLRSRILFVKSEVLLRKAKKPSLSKISHRPTEIFVRSKPSFPQHQAPSKHGNFWAKDILLAKNAMLFKSSLMILAKCKLKKQKGRRFRFVLNLEFGIGLHVAITSN